MAKRRKAAGLPLPPLPCRRAGTGAAGQANKPRLLLWQRQSRPVPFYLTTMLFRANLDIIGGK